MPWFIEEILSAAFGWLLSSWGLSVLGIAAIGAAVWFYVAHRWPAFGKILGGTLVVFTLLALIGLCVRSSEYFHENRQALEDIRNDRKGLAADNAEERLRKWMDSFGYELMTVTDDKESYFHIQARLPDGRLIDVFRSRSTRFDRYIRITCMIGLGEPAQQKFMRLPPSKRMDVAREIRNELNRMSLSSYFVAPTLKPVRVEALIPLDAGVREADALRVISDIQSAMRVPRYVFEDLVADE